MKQADERTIFRQSALNRFTSPEPIDQLLQIVVWRIRPLLAYIWQWLRALSLSRTRSTVRVKTPTVLQMEAVECGAAALAIILGYHRRIVPLEELRVRTGVSRDGSKASNLVRAARNYGLLAKGYKKEPGELADLPLPIIVFWNFTHFLVVEGVGRGRFYLNDPATGPRTVSEQEFDESYTGVVLVFAPGPEFEPGGVRRSLLTALRHRLHGFATLLSIALALSILLVVPGLALPVLIRAFVDHVLVRHSTSWIAPVLIGLAAIAVARGVLTWLQGASLLRLHTRLSTVTSRHFFAHLLRLPVEFYTQRYAGDISARVAINDRVAGLLSGDLAVNTLGALFVAFYAVLMVRYSLILATISIGVALLNIVVLRAISRRRVDANRRLGQDRGKLLGTGYAALQMIETVKASGAESDFFARWAGFQARVVNAGQALAVTTQVLALVPVLLSGLNTTTILVLGAALILSGHLTIGTLIAFQALALGFLGPIDQLVTLGSTVQEVEGDMNRLDDVLSYPADPQVPSLEESVSSTEARLRGEIELRALTFGYNRLEPPLIEDLNLALQPGSRVALVGGSGSGKSTVARLMCGLYEPWSGQVRLDGQTRAEVPRATITASLALVDQDINLFAGTVRENITLWDSSISLDDVVSAARDAHIHDDIMVRPGQYESALEERGRDLSGGQRQRLEIARALARNPTILVMDEATSALDPVTEDIVMENLRRRGCTCVIVAHRLSTIRDADEILVFDAGKVVQRGSHAELQSVPGPYSRLIQADAPLVDLALPSTPNGSTAPDTSFPRVEGQDGTLLAACRLVGSAAGISIRPYPFPSAGENLDAIARTSRMRTRQVLLQDSWWERENGPLLGFTEADGAPVALLPMRSGRYMLVNPATGVRTPLSAGVASSLLTNAIMFYRPLPERAIGARDLLAFGLFGARRDVITILLTGIIGALLALIVPVATGLIFSSVIPHDRTSQLAQLGLALSAAAFAVAMFGVVQRIALLRLESRADAGIQAAVWDRLLSLPVWFFRQYEAGDLGDRAMGVAMIHELLSEGVTASILAALFSLASLALLFVYDVGLALVAVGLTVIFAAGTALGAYWELRRRRVQSALEGRLSGLVLQILMGIARFRVAGAEARVLQRWATQFEAKTRATYRAGIPRLALSTWNSVFPILGTLVLFGLVSRGGVVHLGTGTFLAMVAAFGQFIAAGVAFNGAVAYVIEVVPLYERLAPILRTPPEIDAAGAHPGELSGEIRLDGVSFRYGRTGPLILDDVSLAIRPSESIAIVGPSGSGKSTLLRLLLGFEQPESGTVSYDGQDLATLDIREVRRQIGVVLQNGSVTPGFILDNILGAASLTVDDAWQAASMAGIADDIQQLPMGMYTLVSEGGTTFSGGQRQRLLIARALARRPRILFFDEATSALDNLTQATVADSVASLRATRVVIAHRLSTVLQADRIIVMDGGKIRQVGNYQELLRDDGVFKQLAERQLM